MGAGTGLVGVIGGMGPLATADFYRRVVTACSASRDQDHLPLIIWADPRIPDRSDAIVGGGESPSPMLRLAAETLVAAGAESLVVACNTAHVFLDEALANLHVPLLSLIEVTADAAGKLASAGARIAILGTDGTLASGVYQRALEQRGVVAVVPTSEEQGRVMRGIRSAKAGALREAAAALTPVAASLRRRGVTVLIAACTELPELLAGIAGPTTLLDPMAVAADALVRQHEIRNRDECRGYGGNTGNSGSWADAEVRGREWSPIGSLAP